MTDEQIIEEYFRILALFKDSETLDNRNAAMLDAINFFNRRENNIPILKSI